MKRHPSLHPLSEHHHHALVQALLVRRAAASSGPRRAAALRRAAKTFLRFWKKNGRKHFREEEEILLPAYARHTRLEDDRDVVQMLVEHARIRARIAEMEEALEAGRAVEEHVTSLAKMLHDHVRLEEDRIFPRIEAALAEAEMAALGRRFTRLHNTRFEPLKKGAGPEAKASGPAAFHAWRPGA